MKSDLGFRAIRMHQITVRKSVSAIISYNRMPFTGNIGFVLYAEFDNLIFFQNVAMTITVLAVKAQVCDVDSFGHRSFSLDAEIVAAAKMAEE